MTRTSSAKCRKKRAHQPGGERPWRPAPEPELLLREDDPPAQPPQGAADRLEQAWRNDLVEPERRRPGAEGLISGLRSHHVPFERFASLQHADMERATMRPTRGREQTHFLVE